MARTGFESGSAGTGGAQEATTFQAGGQERIELASSDFITDAKMTRDGGDLVLQAPNGETVVIEGYFNADPAPVLHAANGATLTPNLVDAFSRSPLEFAANTTANDESPVGAVEEVKGKATVTRADGTVETITIGTPIYEGDIVETDAAGAVNIVFLDETSMAVSENARLAIDKYTFDPASESGTTNFSVLRGLFVFTSGLIGRDDPDDVSINTPVGSIGIRGTVIAGEINPGGESKISVLEGAIVVKNGAMEAVISQQFETVSLTSFDQPINNIGTLPANDISARFHSVGNVSPSLFTTINDAGKEQGQDNTSPTSENSAPEPASSNKNSTPAPDAMSSIDGSMATLDSRSSSGLAPSGTTAATSTSSTGTSHAATPSTTAAGATSQSATTGSTAKSTSSTNDAPPPSVLENTAGNGTSGGTNTSSGSGTNPNTPTQIKIDLDGSDSRISVIQDNYSGGAGIGYSISALGYANNDGYADFIFTNSINGNSISYVVYGSPSGAPDGLLTLHGDGGAIITALAAGNPGTIRTIPIPDPDGSVNNTSNTIISGIGDFDGDGIEDYLVGQSNYDVAGSAFIISGANTSNFITITGTSGTYLGYSISKIGDINNDGLDDVIVGTKDPDGKAYIIYGGSASWSNTINLSSHSTTIVGTAFSRTGESVSGIGDFNGDGKLDYAVGSLGSNTVKIYGAGSTIGSPIATFSGTGDYGTEVAGIGDINGDGYSDILIGGDPSQNVLDIKLGGGASGSLTLATNMGGYTLAGAGSVGDFNGDGYDDFVVSLSNTTDTKSYVVFGSKDFTTQNVTIDTTFLSDYRNAIELHSATGSAGLDIARVGDINGDGYDDFAIGNPEANSGHGSVTVVHGFNTGSVTPGTTASTNGQSLVGTANNETLSDGGHQNISMRGGAGSDLFSISNTQFVSIDGGGGYDYLSVNGNLDFTSLNYEKISGIEHMEYTGTGQTITLSLENIFNLLKNSDNGIFKIESNGGNFLNITGAPADYTDADQLTVRGALSPTASMGTNTTDFEVFNIGGYQLYIDVDLTVNLQT